MIAGWSILSLLILIVVVAAGITVVVIALRRFEVKIPDWVVQIFWVLVVAVVAVLALKLLWGLIV